jgi:HopA1 effector protein family
MQNTTNIPAILHAIASEIKIESNFSLLHPQYQPFSLSPEAVERFSKNSKELQAKFSKLILRNFIYGIYFNASLKPFFSDSSKSSNTIYPLHQNLENHSLHGIDEEFYEALHTHNHGTGYFDPDWQVLRKEPDGSLAVIKGGLTMYAETDHHLEASLPPARRGDLISVLLTKNRLKNGFYIAIGNCGQEKQEVGQIYFNLSSPGAIALTDLLTFQLNTAKIPFSLQILSHPVAFGRYDAATLHFEKPHYPSIHKILESIYPEIQPYLYIDIPLFSKYLAPGIGLIEEPIHKPIPQESFGMNRCQILAIALFDAWQKGIIAPEEKIRLIQQHLSEWSVNLEYPYLNPNSEDIYTVISEQ